MRDAGFESNTTGDFVAVRIDVTCTIRVMDRM
jgi:hypothetical protein